MDDDPFKVSESNGGSVPDDRIATISGVLEEAYRPLREALKRGDAESFELFKKFDDLTVREYLEKEMCAITPYICAPKLMWF